ncbi:MAG: Crp/Fnr family transcriptional regulator [Bacteroidota bacterium]|nr:Crp/Fnr family transcriptional regulator [Bacteroidota bacterium]
MRQTLLFETAKDVNETVADLLEYRPNQPAGLKERSGDNIEGLRKIYSTRSTLDELVSNRSINKYKKKQLIFSEGNHATNLYFIVRGKVKTYKTNDYGKQLVLDLYTEHDFMGYIPLLENTFHKETAEALEETEVAVIPRSEFEDLMLNNCEVRKMFIHLLAKNITENKKHLLGLAYNSLRKKVAEALLFIFSKYNANNNENTPIEISRDNLAAIAGTATESLIRTLTDFKNEKLIGIDNGIITIMNKKKLENLID